MIIKFQRYLKGYLEIEIKGYSPERFFNLCKNKNIQIWGIYPYEQSYVFFVLLSDFYKLKTIRKKTGIRLRIKNKNGLPFLLYHLKSRRMYVIGLFSFSLFIIMTSQFIWNIDITGNSRVTDDVLQTYLKQNNIKIGSLKSKLNCSEITDKIRKEYKDIAWVSTSIDGSNLCIEIKEKIITSETSINSDDSSNIVAKKDGKIVNIITRTGIPFVAIGDEVVKGDILISGQVDVMNDNKEVVHTKYVKSDGEIWAETKISYYDQISTVHKEKKYKDKNKKQFNLQIYNLAFDFWNRKTNKSNNESLTIYNESTNFLIIKNIKPYEWTFHTYTEDRRNQMLNLNFQNFCNKLKEDGNIVIDKKIEINHYSSQSIAKGTIIIQENIGVERKTIDLYSENVLQ